jgi:hypothetical protein
MSLTAAATRPDRPRPPIVPLPAALRHGVWLLPLFGALALWATWQHQPDVETRFTSWAGFVTTRRFLATHLLGSIGGQVAYLLGSAALAAVLLATSRRRGAAVAGFALGAAGSAGLLAGFGVAAFAQPAIGHLELDGVAGASALYDDVYGPWAFVVLIGGALLFSAGAVLTARAALAAGAPRWAAVAFGAAAPLIGVVGVALGAAQTVGSVAALAGGARLARWARDVPA